MSERRKPDKYRPLTDDEKRDVIARAREFVPYDERSAIDQLGSYAKHFRLQDEPGFVSIYMPGLAGTHILGEITSDCVWIIKRVPEELDHGIGLTHITNYMIDLIDLSAVHITDTRVFDIATGAEIKPDIDHDERFEASKDEFEAQSSEMTTHELEELTRLLDSLDPNDTFELPDA
jgi:hypothetical protein